MHNFRCHKFFDTGKIDPNLKITTEGQWSHISGSNGVGKTSALEAVSLLVPGRGMRNATQEQITSHQSSQSWSVCFEFDSCKLLMAPSKHGRSITRTHGLKPEKIGVFWITPQSYIKFSLSKSERRAFLDHCIEGCFPEYRKHILSFKKAYINWSECCRRGLNDLFFSYEKIMEEHSKQINSFRKKWLNSLSYKLGVEEIEIDFFDCGDCWESARRKGVINGPHRADIRISSNRKTHENASTGEKKIMMFGVMLSAVEVNPSQTKILLLDDWSENFDVNFQNTIKTELLKTQNLQIFSSGVK